MTQQAIAEVNDQERADSADAPGADRSAEPQYLTTADLDAQLKVGLGSAVEYLERKFNAAFDSTKGHFDRSVAQIAKERGVSQERAEAILVEFATEQGMAPERIAAVRDGFDARTKAQQDAADRKALEDDLAAERALKGNPALALRQAQADALWKNMVRRAEGLAKTQGVDAQPHIERAVKERWESVKGATDIADAMADLEDYVGTLVKAAGAAAHRDRQPADPQLDTTPANGGRGSDRDRYIKGLSTNGLPRTKEEREAVDRITAKFLT